MILTNTIVEDKPLIRPCWRWKGVELLFNEPDRKEVPDERVTQDALKYLKTRDTSKFPEIHSSYQIFQENGHRRAEMEARILAEQSDSAIGGFCKVTPKVVQIYSDLFFCMREVSGASAWKLRHAVGKPYVDGFRDHNLRQMWALIGLTKQKQLLNLVIESFYDELKPDDELTLSVYLRPDSNVDMLVKCHIAERILKIYGQDDRWGYEFIDYFNLTQDIPEPEERKIAVQEYKLDRINFAYLHLMGKIKKHPRRRKFRKESPSSPVKEISKIQKRLRSLELCSS